MKASDLIALESKYHQSYLQQERKISHPPLQGILMDIFNKQSLDLKFPAGVKVVFDYQH